jgi:hypothetical protein
MVSPYLVHVMIQSFVGQAASKWILHDPHLFVCQFSFLSVAMKFKIHQ